MELAATQSSGQIGKIGKIWEGEKGMLHGQQGRRGGHLGLACSYGLASGSWGLVRVRHAAMPGWPLASSGCLAEAIGRPDLAKA